MTEQQQKLKELVQTRNTLVEELQSDRNKLQQKSETIMRIEGMIEGMVYAGIKLPEENK